MDKLDPRLALIYQMVPPCRRAADVGTDHGYLICALVESGRAESGIAADITPLPLDKARREAESRGLSHRVRLVLGDGLAGVGPGEDHHGLLLQKVLRSAAHVHGGLTEGGLQDLLVRHMFLLSLAFLHCSPSLPLRQDGAGRTWPSINNGNRGRCCTFPYIQRKISLLQFCYRVP